MSGTRAENFSVPEQDLAVLERKRVVPRLLLLAFLSLVLLLLCGAGTISALSPQRVGTFAIWGLTSLTGMVLFCTVIKPPLKIVQLLALLTYVIVVSLPAFSFSSATLPRIILLDLYFIVLVASPALLHVWSWRIQAVTSLVTIISVFIMWLPVKFWAATQSIALVVLASVLSALVTFVRREEEESALYTAEEQARELLEEFNKSRLAVRVWNVTLLQAGLVSTLIFLDAALWGQISSPQFYIKVYGLIVLIFGSLFLSIVGSAFLETTIAISTVLVGTSLAIASTFVSGSQLVQGAISLVLLCFTTVRLGWRPERQVAVSWVLILVYLFVNVAATLGVGVPLTVALGRTFDSHQIEFVVFFAGAGLSVITARLLAQHSLATLALSVESGQEQHDSEQSRLGAPLKDPSELWVTGARLGQMVTGLFLLGLSSGFFASILLLRADSKLWVVAGVGWLVFLTVWATLRHLYRTYRYRERLWFLGAFTAILLILWPCVLLIKSASTDEFWMIWPASVFLAIGAVPWSGVELIPLVVVAFISGSEILKHAQMGASGDFLFIVVGIFSLAFSAAHNRRLRERELMKSFFVAIARAPEEGDVQWTLADSLMTLFGSRTALISRPQDKLELIRRTRVFALSANAYPLQSVRDRLAEMVRGEDGVAIQGVAGLPETWGIFDRRFGAFSPQFGLLFEYGTELDKVQRIFLAFDTPLISILKERELRLASLLTAAAVLKLHTLQEQTLRVEASKLQQNEQAEREYELSALVHDINNTVQDLTLLCDSIVEAVPNSAAGVFSWDSEGMDSQRFIPTIKRISITARSMATVVSDAKRKRELERLQDLRPRELVEVCEVLNEILAFAKVRAERKRIVVNLAKLPHELLWVKISAREHLETIVRNLLNNAVMYSDPGTAINVVVRPSAEEIAIDVIDNGPGLSAEECQTIFQSGVRGSSGSRVRGGLGVGLAQSRRVAESAGGTLTVASPGPGMGSTFTVILPRHAAPVIPQGQSAWALMVDDQPETADFYGRVAHALHLTPALAGSVAEAMAVVREKGRPNFVLTDIHLGGSDGLDLVRHLRDEFGGALPILVVSGINDDDIEERARKAGATDFISKPVGRQSLFARIQSLLERLDLRS